MTRIAFNSPDAPYTSSDKVEYVKSEPEPVITGAVIVETDSTLVDPPASGMREAPLG